MIRYAAHPDLIPQDVALSEEELGRVVPWWCAFLGIADWRVSVEYVPTRRLANANRLGEVTWNLNRRFASVLLRDPADKDAEDAYDVEQVLVHELVHVVLAASSWVLNGRRDEDLVDAVAVEQPTDALAQALVALGRHHPGHPLRKKARRR